MGTDRHIWEGWLVSDFINELEPTFEAMQRNAKNFGSKAFETKESVKKWCMDNQPYYKKHIPEVYKHFLKKAGL